MACPQKAGVSTHPSPHSGPTATKCPTFSPGCLCLEQIIQNHIPTITSQLTALHNLLSSSPPSMVELSSPQGKQWRRQVKSLIDSFRVEYAIMNKAFDVLEHELGIGDSSANSEVHLNTAAAATTVSSTATPTAPTAIATGGIASASNGAPDSGWQYAATGTHPGWPWSSILPQPGISSAAVPTSTSPTSFTPSASASSPHMPAAATATVSAQSIFDQGNGQIITGYQTEQMRRLGYAPISAERIKVCQNGQQVILDIGAKVGKECLKFIEYRGSVDVKRRLRGLSARCGVTGPTAIRSF